MQNWLNSSTRALQRMLFFIQSINTNSGVTEVGHTLRKNCTRVLGDSVNTSQDDPNQLI